MAPPLPPSGTDKFRRYRAAKHARGMRLLRGMPEEADALGFLDTAAADIDD